MAKTKPESVSSLEALGRERLSPSFYMRDFLYSEIAVIEGIRNIPDKPDLAIKMGRHLCEELLEPLNATFGRIVLRSCYRSPAVNEAGVGKYNCASNERNFGRHIWDYPGADGFGAMACVAIPWFTDRYGNGADWRSLAYWIHDHLPYSEVEFFDGKGMCTFNIGWQEKPKKTITSWIGGRSTLLKEAHALTGFNERYSDFPSLQRSPAIGVTQRKSAATSIGRQPFSSKTQILESQVELLLMLAADLIERYKQLSVQGDERKLTELFLNSVEYSRFTKAAYGTGFVCGDLSPDFSLGASQRIEDLNLTEIRHWIHTTMRSERHSFGYGSPIMEAIRTGILPAAIERLRQDSGLYGEG